jgi:hypothetical protein
MLVIHTLFTCQSHSIRFIVLCFPAICETDNPCIHCLQRAKRSSKRNLGQRSFRLETSNSTEESPTNKQSLSDDEKKLTVNSNDSDTRPLLETCNSFRSNSPGPKQRRDDAQKPGNEDGGCGFNAGLCLLVICLLVLTFWGKIFAIFCTSTWFYLIPRSTRYASPGDGKVFSGFDFEKNNKKVIMLAESNPVKNNNNNNNNFFFLLIFGIIPHMASLFNEKITRSV